jgi:hypothetical protein
MAACESDVTCGWTATSQTPFSAVYFGNHFAKSGVSKKKSDICKEIGTSWIDDNPTYALIKTRTDCKSRCIIGTWSTPGASCQSALHSAMVTDPASVLNSLTRHTAWEERSRSLKCLLCSLPG